MFERIRNSSLGSWLMGQAQLFIQIFLIFAPSLKYSLCDPKPYTKDEKNILDE